MERAVSSENLGSRGPSFVPLLAGNLVGVAAVALWFGSRSEFRDGLWLSSAPFFIVGAVFGAVLTVPEYFALKQLSRRFPGVFLQTALVLLASPIAALVGVGVTLCVMLIDPRSHEPISVMAWFVGFIVLVASAICGSAGRLLAHSLEQHRWLAWLIIAAAVVYAVAAVVTAAVR